MDFDFRPDSIWTLNLSQVVLGSMKEFFLGSQVFETQLDVIAFLVQNEKKFSKDFDIILLVKAGTFRIFRPAVITEEKCRFDRIAQMKHQNIPKRR